MSLSSSAALLLIDVQQGFDHPRWGARNNPEAERRIAELLAAWGAAGRPVIHVQHLSLEPQSPLRQDSPGHAFKAEAVPMAGEPVFRKHVNSGFIGTGSRITCAPRGSKCSLWPAWRVRHDPEHPGRTCRRRRSRPVLHGD